MSGLNQFIIQNKNALLNFYDPWPVNTSATKVSSDKAAQSLSKYAMSSVEKATETIARLNRIGVTCMTEYVQALLSEKRFVAKLVTALIEQRTTLEMVLSDDVMDIVVELAANVSILDGACSKISKLFDNISPLARADLGQDNTSTTTEDGSTTTDRSRDEADDFQNNVHIAAIVKQEQELLRIDLVHTMVIAIELIVPQPRSLATPWFKMLQHIAPQLDEYNDKIQSLVLLTTLAIIDVGQNNESDSHQSKLFIQTTSGILSSRALQSWSKTSCIYLAWASVLHDYESTGEEEDEELSAEDFACQGISQGAITLFREVFKSLPPNVYFANIGTSVLLAILPYLNIADAVARLIHDVISPYPELCHRFFSDPVGKRALLLTQAKIPALMGPFIWLARAFYRVDLDEVSAYPDIVAEMTTYMSQLSPTFRQFEFPQSDKQWYIKLTEPLQVLPPRSGSMSQDSGEICLSSGTCGEIVTQRGPTVVMWHMDYNGWQLLGRWLEHAHLTGKWDAVATNIVYLIADALCSQSRSELFKHNVLTSLSKSVAQETDLIEIILRQLNAALEAGNETMIEAGIQFLVGLISVERQRVWAYLGTGSGSGGFTEFSLSATTGSFLVMLARSSHNNHLVNKSLTKLTTALVEDCLLGTTFDTTNSKVSVQVTSNVLAELVAHLISVYESSSQWKGETTSETISLCTSILAVLVFVLHSIFRVKHFRRSHQFAVLQKALGVISAQFLGSESTRPITPLLRVIERAGSLKSTNVSSELEVQYVDTLLIFCHLVVKARTSLGLACSALEEQLLFQCRNLTGCYIRHIALHRSVLLLLEALVSASWKGEQPSLLAYLGTEYSEILTSAVAATVEAQFDKGDVIKALCSWFNAVMASKQEGLYILLVEGSKKGESEKSLLNTIVRTVAKEDPGYPYSIIEPLLGTLAQAYGSWLTSASSSKLNSALYQRLCGLIDEAARLKDAMSNFDIEYFADLQQEPDIARDCCSISICAYALRILAVQKYRSPNDKELAQLLDTTFKGPCSLANLSSFLGVQGYMPSLHGSLMDQLSSLDLQLDRYIADPQLRRQYGRSFYYDRDLLEIVLQHCQSATDYENFAQLIAQANINLSLVDAQMNLVDAWCGFLTTLQESDASLLTSSNICDVIVPALQLTKEELGVSLFDKSICERLDMVFCLTLGYKCPNGSNDQLSDSQVLDILVTLLASQPLDSIESMSLATTELQARYFIVRKLLRLVDLQLDHEQTYRSSVEDIIEIVCIKSLRSLISSLALDTPNRTADFLEIISILRKCLRLARTEELKSGSLPDSEAVLELSCVSHLSSTISEVGCDRAVLGLFANALDLGQDGTYAELALMYIIEWLSVKAVAERFISQGLLGVLMESKLAVRIQNVVSTRTDPQIYEIWAKGILTVVLMLLRQFKSKMVVDIVMLLRPYYNQIDNSLRSWDTDGVQVSLTSIDEAYQLFLIFDILKQLSQPQYYPVLPSFSKSVVADCVDYLLSHQKLLQARIFVPRAVNVQSVLPTVIDSLRELRDYLHA